MKITYLNVLRFLLALAASTIIASNALAQQKIAPSTTAELPTAGNPKFEARELGRVAGALYDQHQWHRAYYWYREAEKKFHSPKFVLYAARCKKEMGELVAASHLYERVIDEPLLATATPQYTEAQKEAKDELEKLEKRIPTLRFIVQGANGRNVQITVDNVPVLSMEEPLEVNAGKHIIVAAWGKPPNIVLLVEVDEGEQREVPMALPLEPPKAIVPRTATTQRESKRSLSVGGVIFAAGVPTGFAVAIAGALMTNQPDVRRSISTSATGALIGSGLGLIPVSIIVGAIVTRFEGQPTSTSRAYILPVVTPSGVFLTGTF